MMKFLETHFDDYISSNKKCSLHPKLNKLYEGFPSKVENLKNIKTYFESSFIHIKYSDEPTKALSLKF